MQLNITEINEMRISKGYWLWGLFPSKETIFLNEIKAKVQSKLKSPFFETHITLSGPYFNIDDIFLNNLKSFSEINSPIMLHPKGYDFKKEIFQSFYIPIKNSQRLKELRKNIYDLNDFELENNYSPHISLSYGNHETREKRKLIFELPALNKPINMTKIALVRVNENINQWEILISFDLN